MSILKQKSSLPGKRKCSSLREKCPYSELFWSVFSRILTEYGEILISPYSVRIRENTDQNNSEYGHFLRSPYKKKRRRAAKFILPSWNSVLLTPVTGRANEKLSVLRYIFHSEKSSTFRAGKI